MAYGKVIRRVGGLEGCERLEAKMDRVIRRVGGLEDRSTSTSGVN